MKKKVIKILLSIILCFTCLNINGQGRIHQNISGYTALRNELLSIVGEETLSEWNMLILAICGIESTYKKPKNETFHGFMQISRTYVKEVNRIFGTKYTYDDAHSFKKSVEMHNLMNKAKNKDNSIHKAISIHNGRAEYKQKVLKELEHIKKHEKGLTNGNN